MSKFDCHAEVSIHHQASLHYLWQSKCIGVQFLEELEDVLLAGLLHHACSYLSIDLSIVRFNKKDLKNNIKLFMEDKAPIGLFCKSK